MKLNLEKLNDKQRDFWDFYNQNFDEFKTMSIKEISKIYGCGISFIYNFFNSLGIKGIKELIMSISFEQGQINSNRIFNQELQLEDRIFETINQSNLRNNNLLKENKKIIDDLVNDIIRTKRRFCLGFGYSKLAALDFIGPFNHIDNSFVLVNDEDYEKSKLIQKINNEDILIVFSMRGKNKQLLKYLRYLRKNASELCIYLVTSKLNCLAAQFTDKVILIDNIMKRSDIYTNEIFYSPLQTFLFFNTVVKNILYQKIKTTANSQQNFVNEQLSWIYEKNDIDN
ncbi:MurR/RpiR family transcriptional regulator [Spiroplasma alleghenense]|uniref:HTH rpiR-type domain-containing protein n=1 Tax=Spiroplasma alleghenense TaxID=216931 RepID=A0A345Z309_9MOLU|nr:SIS domain-containing protein [Spiroplasma alleghenense]AXK50988.1 hypothetical protein SALLE_v1c03140 [Spiroplasma alleghenense]